MFRLARNWGAEILGVAIAATFAMGSAPASAHSTPQHWEGWTYQSGQKGCTWSGQNMNHGSWDATTGSKWAVVGPGFNGVQPVFSCAQNKGKTWDGIRVNVEHYLNGNGYGQFACKVAWGVYHNTFDADTWKVFYNGDTLAICNGGLTGFLSMDTGSSVRMDELVGPGDDGHRGGWVRGQVGHWY